MVKILKKGSKFLRGLMTYKGRRPVQKHETTPHPAMEVHQMQQDAGAKQQGELMLQQYLKQQLDLLQHPSQRPPAPHHEVSTRISLWESESPSWSR